MGLNLVASISSFLKNNPEKRFTARELAEWVLKTKPEECRKKQERSRATVVPLTSTDALLQQIVAEIGANKAGFLTQKISMTAERPRKYYFSQQSDEEKSGEIRLDEEMRESFSEHDLYPVLSEYLFSEQQIYSKRIDERKSSNNRGTNGNIWLHPDVVGLKDLSRNWNRETISCISEHAYNRSSLYSFEVKKVLNMSNLRKSFFQAVSNSSWANYAYLVAADIDDKVMEELNMLCSAHGIGVILLNTTPSESQILIPAKERPALDWNMIDRILGVNPDFKDFIILVREFYQTKNIREKDWK